MIKMPIHRKTLFLLSLMASLVVSCGISKEARYASSRLVEQQQKSMEAHIQFHKAVVSSLNLFLDGEEGRSQSAYEYSIEKQEKSLIEALEDIYGDNSLTEVQKKVKEEETRQTIKKRIEKAEEGQLKRTTLISQARENLENASRNILDVEEAKTHAIAQMDKYLQEKRPYEKILDYVNLDLSGFNDKIAKANEQIGKVESIITTFKQNF